MSMTVHLCWPLRLLFVGFVKCQVVAGCLSYRARKSATSTVYSFQIHELLLASRLTITKILKTSRVEHEFCAFFGGTFETQRPLANQSHQILLLTLFCW